MAVPKRKSSVAAPNATQRSRIPIISVMPSDNSAAVAAQATNGIMNAGMKELTCAVYCVKVAKFPQPPYLPQRPKRSATADRKAARSQGKGDCEVETNRRVRK